MKSVFVCSTIWDLVDVRAEIREFLQRNGFQPVMSDYEGFPDDLSHKDTYEKCLEAARTCDIFVLVLNNRYGGSRRPKPGELSITHQEFRAAVTTQRPFIGLVRDKLEIDWQTWKQTQNPEALTFVTKDKDRQLFAVLEEINTSAPCAGALWRETFKDSIELKRKLAFKLGINDFSNNYIAQAQSLQALPRLTLNCHTWMGNWIGAAVPDFSIANIGSGAAETISARLRSKSGKVLAFGRLSDLLPGTTGEWKAIAIDDKALQNTPLTVTLICQNVLGSAFQSEFDIHVIDRAPNGHGPLIARTYFGPPRNYL